MECFIIYKNWKFHFTFFLFPSISKDRFCLNNICKDFECELNTVKMFFFSWLIYIDSRFQRNWCILQMAPKLSLFKIHVHHYIELFSQLKYTTKHLHYLFVCLKEYWNIDRVTDIFKFSRFFAFRISWRIIRWPCTNFEVKKLDKRVFLEIITEFWK